LVADAPPATPDKERNLIAGEEESQRRVGATERQLPAEDVVPDGPSDVSDEERERIAHQLVINAGKYFRNLSSGL
jgi:hypothetical protein